MTIELTQDRVACIDAGDWPKLRGYKWRFYNGYAVATYERLNTLLMHRIVADAPPGYQVEHIDGNNLNNVKNNLKFIVNTYKLFDSNTVEVDLDDGKVCFIDLEDWEKLKHRKWRISNTGYGDYVVTGGRTKHLSMHRAILNAPSELQTDHIDHNGLNNRKSNLRLATNQQNSWNRRKMNRNCTSKYKGVSYGYNKWEVNIRVNGKSLYLGSFDTEIDAAIAYNNAALIQHGEFACLNQV